MSKETFTPADSILETMLNESDLESIKLEERDYILLPWLRRGVLGMLYGPRGTGKSFFALSIALAVTRMVPLGPWVPVNAVNVLYVDGEMQVNELQDRFKRLAGGINERPVAQIEFLSSVYASQVTEPPNLANPRWRDAFFEVMEGRPDIGLLILDPISALVMGIDENDKFAWDPINSWLLQLRALGKGLLFTHHSGKSGDQRGTSSREDFLDIVIRLSEPAGYKAEDGAKCEMSFQKARAIHGEGAAPFGFSIAAKGSNLVWLTGDITVRGEAVRLLGEGFSTGEVAKIVGRSESRISHIKKDATKKGQLK